MSKNHILLALFFAICWSFNAEAIMGMSASKALSYSNTVSGVKSAKSSPSTGKAIINKKSQPKNSTHTVTMSNMDSNITETKKQTVNAGDYINVILPAASWDVDMSTCNGTRTVTDSRITFKIEGVNDSSSTCEIKLYGTTEESELLNKIFEVTVK